MVTRRCLVMAAAPRGTSIPRVGSVTGSRGLVLIWTSSGVARGFTMTITLSSVRQAVRLERYP
jgi:hypothetical protein